MAHYAYVENNQVLEWHNSLPKSWKNVSGLNLLKDDIPALNALGWYTVTQQIVSYNTATQRIASFVYSFNGVSVDEIPVIEDIPPGEIVTFEKQKEEFLQALRQIRTIRLSETDWTALTDCPLSAEKKNEYEVYRQNLRDLPNLYKDNDILLLDNVAWPDPPLS
jgi:hypothetical protein